MTSNSTHKTKISDSDDLFRRQAILADGSVSTHIYEDEDGNNYGNATSILNLWEDEEKERKIQQWKENNDGENGTEHHSTILRFSQLRGTYLHAKAQQKYSGRDLWGEEEKRAEEELKNFGDYEGRDAYELVQEYSDWFVDEVHDILDERLDEVLYTEQYVYSSNPKFAGQVDLVYRDVEGDVVVCDLKTSKLISYSHLMQSNAYASVFDEVLDEPVSKIEVIQASPERKTSEVKTLERGEHPIVAESVVDTEYGLKVSVSSPYEAKSDINSLEWDKHKQTWHDETETWVFNPEMVGYALYQLTNMGWSVDYRDGLKQEIVDKCGLKPDNVNLDNPSNPHDDFRGKLLSEFQSLVDTFNEQNRPFTFPEEIIENKSDDIDSEVVENAIDLITENRDKLGEYHPNAIAAGAVCMFSTIEGPMLLAHMFDTEEKEVEQAKEHFERIT